MIVAWRIAFVTMLGRDYPNLPCETIFEEEEWKSVYEVLHKEEAPKKPLPLQDFVMMIAQLGGHVRKKNGPPPGPKPMWLGMQRMYDISWGWKIKKEIMEKKLKN